MKTKILTISLYIILAVSSVSFSDPYTVKRISDVNFRYEFYTTNKNVKPRINKTYYWFKGGAIHNAQSGIAGELLHDKFVKMYNSNQLAEQGQFKKGLKIGLWRTWHPNGIVETNQNWNSGLKSGMFYKYDENGNLIEKGSYNGDKKHGKWIDFVKKDTIEYKNGDVYIKKIKLSKEKKIELKEANKKAKESKKGDLKSKKTTNTNETSKTSFFKRLFSKKNKSKKTND